MDLYKDTLERTSDRLKCAEARNAVPIATTSAAAWATIRALDDVDGPALELRLYALLAALVAALIAGLTSLLPIVRHHPTVLGRRLDGPDNLIFFRVSRPPATDHPDRRPRPRVPDDGELGAQARVRRADRQQFSGSRWRSSDRSISVPDASCAVRSRRSSASPSPSTSPGPNVSMPSATQYPNSIVSIVNEANALYGRRAAVTHVNALSDTKRIPVRNPRAWMKIRDVICAFADMHGSTKLSVTHHENGTARAYQPCTGAAVRIFNDFEPPYIDVRGDGALAPFDSNQPHRALATAVTFRTFAREQFHPAVERDTKLEIGGHLGIDMRSALVRKIGMKRRDDRSDRRNEAWAGRPVNMAAKLAGSSEDDELVVSDRFPTAVSGTTPRRSAAVVPRLRATSCPCGRTSV